MSARSRTPAWRTSCSTLNAYSKAAPSHVQVPWPMPTTSVWCSPCCILAIDASKRRRRLDGVARGAHREGVAVGPSPGVAPKLSFGPVALIR